MGKIRVRGVALITVHGVGGLGEGEVRRTVATIHRVERTTTQTAHHGGAMISKANINLLIVHQDPLMAAGMAAVLSMESRIQLHSIPANAEIQESDIDGTDVVVADYQSGIALLSSRSADIRRIGRAVAVIIVTPLNREFDVRAALRAGISGYLLQSCQAEELRHAVLSVSRGARYLCPSITDCIADNITLAALTGRESSVLALVAAGTCNKVIARDLEISVGTVKCHMSSILAKLKSTSRTQAVLRAAERGLIDPPGTRVPSQAQLYLADAPA
jgi:DNA-binding NarL/FixJ family response regulator